MSVSIPIQRPNGSGPFPSTDTPDTQDVFLHFFDDPCTYSSNSEGHDLPPHPTIQKLRILHLIQQLIDSGSSISSDIPETQDFPLNPTKVQDLSPTPTIRKLMIFHFIQRFKISGLSTSSNIPTHPIFQLI